MAAPHPRRIQAALVGWLDERYAFSESISRELYRRVPNYAAALPYYLGGTVVILIVLEFIIGFLLGVYYIPDGTGNRSTVQYAEAELARFANRGDRGQNTRTIENRHRWSRLRGPSRGTAFGAMVGES